MNTRTKKKTVKQLDALGVVSLPLPTIPAQSVAVTGRPLKFKTPQELQEKIDAYFAHCDPHPVWRYEVRTDSKGNRSVKQIADISKQRPYTISGLASHLDTSRDVLLDYQMLVDKTPDQLPAHLKHAKSEVLAEFSNTIKKAKVRVEGYVEEKLLSGGQPAGPIFNLKNNFARWEDKSIVDNPQETEMRLQIASLRDTVTTRYQSHKKKK